MIKIVYVLWLFVGISLVFNKSLDRTRRYAGEKNLAKILRKTSSRPGVQSIMYKEGHDEYDKIHDKLKKAGLDINPYEYQLIRYITIIVIFFLVLAINYTNMIDGTFNADKLQKIAEIAGEDSAVAQAQTTVNFLPSVALGILGYFIPDGILKLITGYRKAKGQSEITMLHTYAVMMLKTRRSVKQILISLMERSVVYKKDLELAVNTFSRDPNRALNELIDNVGDENLKKVFTGLLQALNNDADISIVYLENHRNLTKEMKKINRKKKNSQKSLVGLIMMIVPLIVLGAVGGYPWLIFAIQQLENVPV